MTENNLAEGFIPILTIMPDYGNAPFLWLVDTPGRKGVGGNICDAVGWGDWCRMSKELWERFADWAWEFEQTRFSSDDFDPASWDWGAFHEQGLKLATALKVEVGDSYRVVYEKPHEDPDMEIDERREVLSGGALIALPSHRSTRIVWWQ